MLPRLSVHSAMVLATEIVDWHRFEHPRQLACYLGLVSRKDSSGDVSCNACWAACGYLSIMHF